MGKHDRYPDEMVEYVRQHCGECTVAEMAERVTALFGRPVSYDQMKAFYKNHKCHTIPRKGRPGLSRYPAGMEEFIRQVAPGRSKYEIADLVNEKYGDGTITPELVHVYKKNHKIRSGNDTRFKKGQVPPNKGTHPVTKGRMAETQFKKGNRPHNWRPVGSERNVIGLVEIKVAEPNVWKFKHLGLRPGMYKRIFKGTDGELYFIRGFNLRAPKYPIIISRVSDGEESRCTEGFIEEMTNEYYLDAETTISYPED